MKADDPVEFFGASATGPGHISEGKPNEDCWLGTRGAFGTLIVVSDGVGSRSEARRGARMACQAVHAAVRAWHAEGSSSVVDLVGRVEPLWLERIVPSAADDCAATCLFALADGRGSVHVAGVGDGMALLKTREGRLEWVVGPRVTGFASDTEALGQACSWKHASFPVGDMGMVVLASDGVADDLLPDRIGEFATWLREEFAPLALNRRCADLKRELTDWPTPRHSDDKTLVVLIRREVMS